MAVLQLLRLPLAMLQLGLELSNGRCIPCAQLQQALKYPTKPNYCRKITYLFA